MQDDRGDLLVPGKALLLEGICQMQPPVSSNFSCMSCLMFCRKDLEFIVDHTLNMSEQCDAAANKANAILGCINRNIVSRSCEAMILNT